MPNSNLSHARKFDRICSEFEDAWSADSRQDFERYLNQFEPNHRDDLLRALVEVDIELRRRDRQTITKEDYAQFGASILDFVEKRIATNGQQAPVETIQRLCNEFRNELSEGKSPSVSDFAKRVDEQSRVPLIRNLLHIDIDHRRRAGEVTHTVDYVRDMPEHSSLISNAFYETAVQLFHGDSPPSVAGQTGSTGVTQGSLLGEYQLLGELGRGGMGAVYEARHTKRGYHVALKVLPTVDGRSLQYFKGEFRRMAEINHPNLIGLQTLQADGGVWFFTMELVRGTDFLSWARPSNNCDPSRLRSALPQLAAALFKLHSENIIHCDLKPANVLVDPEGRVVVLDFGLAFKGGNAEHVTGGRIAGTPAYMAPEQAAGGAVTGAADWYAVGVMLFQALTGELPITGNSALEFLHIKQSQPAPKCQVSDESLAELATLADELLRIDVAARPNALEIAARLSNSTIGTDAVNAKTDTTLVGREKQIASLDRAFHQVQVESAPSIVFVSGRSGEGKTSLVEHFLSKSTVHPVALSGRCYDRESVPFKALDGLIDQLTNHLTSLPEQDAALLMPDDIDFLADLFPVLNRVDAVRKLKARSRGALDQQQVRTRAFAALKALLTRMTRNTPVVLFSGDLQWGDEDSADALFQILCTDEPPQLMFVGSYRSEETATSPFIAKWRQLTQDLEIKQHLVTVSPLSIDECTQLAIQIIGEDNATIREMVFQFAAQTGGNPMLFIELIGCYDPLSDTFEALPIEELIARKLDRLPQSAKPLLHYLAVSGQRSLLDEIAQASATQLDSDSVATALRSEKLIRIAGEGEFISIDTYHDKIREAVLRRLADDERSSMHRSLAGTIEEASGTIGLEDLRRACDDNQELDDALKSRLFDLSYHCDAAGDSQKAYLYASLAARQASQQFSQSVAAEQYAVAKRNLDSNDKHAAFLVARGLGRARCLLGDYEQAKEELQGATELTTDAINQAEVLGLQAQIEHKLGEISRGVDFYGQAIRRIGYHVPRNLPDLIISFGYELAIQAFHTIAPRSWYKKERDLSRSEALAVELFNRNSIVSYYMNTMAMLWTHMKGLNLAETRNDSLELAYAYGLHPAPAAAAGLAGRGLRYSERAFKIADDASDLLTLGHAFTMRSMACFALGRHAEGAEHGVRGSEYLESAGDTYLRYLSEIHATLCYWQLGMPQNGIRLAIDCFERSLMLGERVGMSGSLYGLSLATEGKLPHAALRSCVEVSDENHFDMALTTQSEGVWHLQHRRFREAVETLEKAWLHARAHFVLTPYTTSCISWLLTAIRQLRENAPEEYQREERQFAKKARSCMRQARCLSWMYPTAKPHLYREIGLYHASRGNLKKSLQWLKKSINAAHRFGAVTESSKSVVELAGLDANWTQTIDPEQHERAQETLQRIEEETNAIVSAEWRLEASG